MEAIYVCGMIKRYLWAGVIKFIKDVDQAQFLIKHLRNSISYRWSFVRDTEFVSKFLFETILTVIKRNRFLVVYPK